MRLDKLLLLVLFMFFTGVLFAEDRVPLIKGKVLDEGGQPLIGASVYIEGTRLGTITDDKGYFVFRSIYSDTCRVSVRFLGYVSQDRTVEIKKGKTTFLHFKLQEEEHTLEDVEVFGVRKKQPDKLDVITRLPLRPSEQIQSISIISNKLIEEQGNLTMTEAVQNVVGVTLFGSFGGVQESFMTRGYRGIPTLKNGVRVQSDFRGGGFLTDMQGVESIQVLKGSAAITQGLGNDLGSAGGVINIATKTPKFTNSGEVGVRAGSWGLFRPVFDVQGVLDRQQTVALRVNGAYERSDSYRKHVSSDRIYVNPSLVWRPNDNTKLILEMDYLHDTRTPDRGTVNLAIDSVDALYKMPHDKFLGFKTDRAATNNLTYALRFERQLNDFFNLRVAYAGSRLETDNAGATTSKLKDVGKTGEYNFRSRSLTRSTREDKNTALQIDLIGQDLFTGGIKHTFQVGADFRTNALKTVAYGAVVTDTIDVLHSINNDLPDHVSALKAKDPVESNTYEYGLMVQDVITLNKYVKAMIGVRYSHGNSNSNTSTGFTPGKAWNPLAGLIITPVNGLNIFGSYTTTTSLRSAADRMEDGSSIGASRSDQYEVGIKSYGLKDRLRFNFTYFHILNKNLAYAVYDENWTETGFYDKAGSLRRQGIETELTGRLLSNLEVIVGYAFLKAEYEDSPAYKEGSAPINTPKHTANGWAYYTLEKGALKGLSLGLGAYYVGKRPVNDYTIKASVHDTQPNLAYFDMAAYTTVNVQLAYQFNKFRFQAFFNNIFDSTGYTSYYRGGYINPTDPFNVSGSISYRF